MKYHGHEIIKQRQDLGENDNNKNCVYIIKKDGEYLQTALTVSSAKEYIDTGYNENYL